MRLINHLDSLFSPLFQPSSKSDLQTRKQNEINIDNFKNFQAKRRWKVSQSHSYCTYDDVDHDDDDDWGDFIYYSIRCES